MYWCQYDNYLLGLSAGQQFPSIFLFFFLFVFTDRTLLCFALLRICIISFRSYISPLNSNATTGMVSYALARSADTERVVSFVTRKHNLFHNLNERISIYRGMFLIS